MRGVRIRLADGAISETVNINKPVAIELEYELTEADHIIMPYHHLRNDDGVMIFCAHDTDPAWLNRPRPKGRYVSKAWIPENLLSEGTIMVSSGLMTLSPDVYQFYERDVVSFQVVEDNGNGLSRGAFAGNMDGAVRPLLKWETDVSEQALVSSGLKN